MYGCAFKMRAKIIQLVFGVLLLVNFSYSQSEVGEEDDITIETVPETDDEPYESPIPADPSKVYFSEHFDDESLFSKTWVKSQAKKDGIDDEIAKYDGEWRIEEPTREGLKGDKGLVLKTQAKHAAISASLKKPFVFEDKPFIIQYEVTLQDGQQCGGAYLKLLSHGPAVQDLKLFHDKTPYTIMFGPDKCGGDFKLHFIFNHVNPLNGSVEEKHCKKSEERLEDLINDKLPHLYTLILKPTNDFEIFIDNKLINSGDLLSSFEPPVNPPKEVDDPNDSKPADWDEREKVPDPEAKKPDDWDEDAPAQIVDENAAMPEGWLENEPAHIPDPSGEKPTDWDSEMDGEWEPALVDNPKCKDAVGCGPWEPPLINNPAFKGKWRAPLIDNPNYKGKWRPKLIPNPNFFEDKTPFKMKTISAVGFELWSMSKDILFDNIIITEDITVARKWADDTYQKKKQKIARDSESIVDRIASLTNEYPFLWIVYILLLAVPVIFILYFCCSTPDKPTEEEKHDQRRAAEKKKTDEVTEDVVEQNEDVDEGENDNVEEEENVDDREESSEEVSEEPKENSSPKPAESTRKRKVRKE